jgi:hypothetical protein
MREPIAARGIWWFARIDVPPKTALSGKIAHPSRRQKKRKTFDAAVLDRHRDRRYLKA